MFLRELYENLLLFENYKPKLIKLTNELPDQAADIKARVEWAESRFRNRSQSVLWYLSLYEYWLKQNTDPKAKAEYERMLGGANPINDFPAFEAEMDAHWTTGRYSQMDQIKQVFSRINAQTTTVKALIDNLTTVEEDIKKADEEELKNKTPIAILEGDHVILPLGNQGDWWLLPRKSHDPESKFMGHCGTAQGGSNVLLSLRDKTPVPWVTMEYNPDKKVLHQMKGRSNSKPSNKFHYAILALLVSDLVDGIYTGATYQPSSDFSIFDMKEDLVNQIGQVKPNLIVDQINKFPIDFLRAPVSIRSNPSFRSVAIKRLPGINILVDDAGTVSTDESTWEESIKIHPMMIIYAPHTIHNWGKRVTDRLLQSPEDLGYCDNRIRGSYNIMKAVIEKARPSAIELVPFRVPHYKELALLALSEQPQLIKAINTTGWPVNEVKAAWARAANHYLTTPTWPENLFTPDELKSIWKEQIQRNGNLILKVPNGLFDNNEAVELWSLASTQNPNIILHHSFIDNTDISEDDKDEIRLESLRRTGGLTIAEFRPDLVPDEKERTRFWYMAVRRNPSLAKKLPDALIPSYDKHQIVLEMLRSYPENVVDCPYTESFLDEHLAKIWIQACRRDPYVFYKVPERFLKHTETLKQLWISVFTSDHHNPHKLSDIPKGLFHIELLRSITKGAIERDPDQIMYADPEAMDAKTKKEALVYLMKHSRFSFLYSEKNPTPPETFTNEEIRDLWTDGLESLLSGENEDDSSYLITANWLPYHLLDHDLIKRVLFDVVEHGDNAENDCIINHLNYTVFTKILTPEEITRLHVLTIQNANNGERGGPFAAIPKRYQTYELAEIAIRHSMYELDAVIASDNFSEEQINALREMAGFPGEDESMQDYIREEKEATEAQQWRPDPFEVQQ